MYNRPPFLIDLLHLCELIAVLAGIYKLKTVKNTYWKWFVFYLIYIFCYEIISYYAVYTYKMKIGSFMALIQIPIEYLFLFWLFALQSLKKEKLFWFFTFIYTASLILEFLLSNIAFTFKSLNNTFGAFLLLILVILEFIKQIKSDRIINFREDKMFYINLGVILFYIGNMPFFGWYHPILKIPEIWNSYYIYFMISNCIMYLLFAASFIWGRPK